MTAANWPAVNASDIARDAEFAHTARDVSLTAGHLNFNRAPVAVTTDLE